MLMVTIWSLWLPRLSERHCPVSGGSFPADLSCQWPGAITDNCNCGVRETMSRPLYLSPVSSLTTINCWPQISTQCSEETRPHPPHRGLRNYEPIKQLRDSISPRHPHITIHTGLEIELLWHYCGPPTAATFLRKLILFVGLRRVVEYKISCAY